MDKIYARQFSNINIGFCHFIARWHVLFLLLCYTLFCLNRLEAQPSYIRKENNMWVGMGALNGQPNGGGIDFNNGIVQPVSFSWMGMGGDLAGLNVTAKCGAVVCNEKGELLFYTDGIIIWNRNHNVMQGGWDINNNTSNIDSFINQQFGESVGNLDGVVIIPMPGNSHKYYVFSCPFFDAGSSSTLYATVVDMELNEGLGAVDPNFRGVPIADSMVSNIQGITGDNCNYWLLGYGYYDGSYKAFNITEEGINANPVVSTVTPPLSPYYPVDLCSSPDRHKVAMTLVSEVQLCNFDPATGIVSNDILIGSQFTKSIAFSPNSQVLYLSGIIAMRQYDLNNITNEPTFLMFNNYTSYEYDGPIRLGPDNKMYLTYDDGNINGSGYAARINHPDVVGPGCQMELIASSSFPLLKWTTIGGYLGNEVPIIVYDTASEMKEAPICFHQPAVLSPGVDGTDYHWMVNTIGTTFVRKGNDSTDTVLAADPGTYAVQYYTANPCTFHRDTFIVKDVNYSLYLGTDRLSCDGSPVSLDAGAIAGATYLWQDSSVNSGLEADTSGLYWVEVDKQGCTARDSVTITIMEQQDLGDDTLMCIEDAIGIPMHAHVPPGASVLWNTGATTPSIQAQDSGLYWVQVTYADCTVSDSMYIHKEYCDCSVLFPSAFSPNGDGVNDRFGPVADGACPITDYRIEVYNRWGQRVFVSFNAAETWDGTVNGKPADAGTYMYRVQARSGLRYTVLQQKGDVTLIR